MATNELSESAKRLIEEWSNEKLTPEQVKYNRKASGETEEEGVRYANEFAGKRASEYPTFSLSNGKVKLSGSSDLIKSDIVSSASDLIKEYYKGADLSVEQNAESLQTALDKINEQIKSQMQYQEYADFLDKSGFSDEAYRNYALTKTETDPTTTTNLMNSKKKIWAFDKNGNKIQKTPAEWLAYWTAEYTPEERIKLWIGSAEALSEAKTDDDLYRGVPYLIMGHHEAHNVPAGVWNQVNPFDDGKTYKDAKVNAPIYGFDDVSSWEAFWDAFASTNKEAFARMVKFAGTSAEASPLSYYLKQSDVATPEDWGAKNGLENVSDKTLLNISRDDWNKYADIANNYFFKKLDPSKGTPMEQLIADYGEEEAAKILFVSEFSTKAGAIGADKRVDRDATYERYETFKGLQEGYQSEEPQSPLAKWGREKSAWGREKEKEMEEHIANMGIIAPSATTAGVVGGTIARMMAEQLALNLVSGGALSAQNIVSNLSREGWKAVGLDAVTLGQKVASKSPALSKALYAMANGSIEGTKGASKVIYVIGTFSKKLARDYGEDIIRSLVDDALTANSLDSQGNLDPDLLLENVYMNALMLGMAHGVRGALRGIGAAVGSAKARNIDGVELNSTQINQLDQLQKALDDQNTRVKLKGYTKDGNPIVTAYGRTKVLDQITPTGDVTDQIAKITGVAAPTVNRTIDKIVNDTDLSEQVKTKVAQATKGIDTNRSGWKKELKENLENLTDDEIREAFPEGVVKVGDETIRIDTKNFTAGDIFRTTGKELKNLDEAIYTLKSARNNLRDFASASSAILRYAPEFADNFADAVETFARDNNMSVHDVMVALRDSRIAKGETIPGLKDLWDNNWKPLQDTMLDLEESFTGKRPQSVDFYTRDMIKGTFIPKGQGAWGINEGGVAELLGGEASFDLTASSTARNTGKLAEMAADQLEDDPRVLAQEFVASRMQSIWDSSEQGRVYSTMREAHEAGEYDFTEEDAIKSVHATKQVAKDVGDSEGVKEIQELTNVQPLGNEFDKTIIDDIDAEIVSLQDGIKQLEAEIKTRKAPQYEKQTIDGFHQLDYETRKQMVEDFVQKNPEYIAVYRNQNTGVDDWYSNGTGAGGDPRRFESIGPSDKGDLTDAVWLTTDEEWARGPARATAGTVNGEPEYTVVIPIKKNLIVDAGGEFPSYREGLGEADMSTPWGPYYSLRRFSELHDDKALLTKATEKIAWEEERDARVSRGEDEIVTSSMRDRLNPKYYDSQELVLFRDLLPEIKSDGEKKVISFANKIAKEQAEREINSRVNKRAISSAEASIRELKDEIKNLEARKADISKQRPAATVESDGTLKTSTGKTGKAAVDELATANKEKVVNVQKKFNESAKRSNAAEKLSNNSGYRNRGVGVSARDLPKPVGVRYIPKDPFKGISGMVNDHFVKALSVVMEFNGYDAAGNPKVINISAYDGGYKMYAEAGTFARNVIVDIQRGDSLWDAINKQVTDNGFFIEPSEYQRKRYGALTTSDQAAKVTDDIIDRIGKDDRRFDAFDDSGAVKNTEALLSILTTRFRGQGIKDFSKFLRKANMRTFSEGQRKWLNRRFYEMTASVNKKTFGYWATKLAKAFMRLRYDSNMALNFKNGQLQLTEGHRAYTMNKLGDFASMIKRMATDSEFRQTASDYAYILAPQSMGRGLAKSDLDSFAETISKVGAASDITKKGIYTNIDNVNKMFGKVESDSLAMIEGGEYAKNLFLIAGFLEAGEKQGLKGADLDTYIRNRFNTEALAGTNVGKIGLNDSTIGQVTFMYLGFPIRNLALEWHMLVGGGLRGDFLGTLEYLSKMLGAKGLLWALEAPWGYSLATVLGYDPFGFTESFDPITTDWQDRDPFWRWVDLGVDYNPFTQGAIISAFADVYHAYRAAEEEAREDYKKKHNGSTEGFVWTLSDAGAAEMVELLKGFTPGYTAYSRVAGEISDLDRGYRTSMSGNRQYETNTDLANVLWGLLTGRRNTANARDYFQTSDPIGGIAENGLAGLGQAFERGINPFRGFREFDPIDTDTYEDWFNGSYLDQQNWNSGIYAFRDEAQEIKDRYERYGTDVSSQNARENEFGDLRRRLEKFVQAYTNKHPEGISVSKQNQLINIFNLSKGQTLDEAVREDAGNADYSEWEAAKSRYSQGAFPTPYGMTQSKTNEVDYAQAPELQRVLSEQRYGIDSTAAPAIKELYNEQLFDTPEGRMTMKDYHDKVYARLSEEWDKSKPDYDHVAEIQEAYLEELSKNIIQPILNTYGSQVLSAGKSSDIMQEFGKMLNGMIPTEEYRLDKKGRRIFQSTPYMTVDIQKWLNKNYKDYRSSVNVTNRGTQQRITSIRESIDAGRSSTAKAKARALIQDIGRGRASVSRDELEWLQGVLND